MTETEEGVLGRLYMIDSRYKRIENIEKYDKEVRQDMEKGAVWIERAIHYRGRGGAKGAARR